ncbi:MAG: hypothetical protein GY774_09600 [Planctomycetes bacterium]|nr:hypothetical protein [Planctomycetota bacterium]
MKNLRHFTITGIVLAGIGLFTMLSGCVTEEEVMYGSRLGTMEMASPDATVQEAEAVVFAGMREQGEAAVNSNDGENSINQVYISGKSNPSKVKVIYYVDGTVCIPALTDAKIKIHYSDGSVGTGTLKVKNGRSLFWEDQSGIDSITNFGIHSKNEQILNKDNLHWFSVNGTRLSKMVE